MCSRASPLRLTYSSTVETPDTHWSQLTSCTETCNKISPFYMPSAVEYISQQMLQEHSRNTYEVKMQLVPLSKNESWPLGKKPMCYRFGYACANILKFNYTLPDCSFTRLSSRAPSAGFLQCTAPGTISEMQVAPQGLPLLSILSHEKNLS